MEVLVGLSPRQRIFSDQECSAERRHRIDRRFWLWTTLALLPGLILQPAMVHADTCQEQAAAGPIASPGMLYQKLQAQTDARMLAIAVAQHRSGDTCSLIYAVRLLIKTGAVLEVNYTVADLTPVAARWPDGDLASLSVLSKLGIDPKTIDRLGVVAEHGGQNDQATISSPAANGAQTTPSTDPAARSGGATGSPSGIDRNKPGVPGSGGPGPGGNGPGAPASGGAAPRPGSAPGGGPGAGGPGGGPGGSPGGGGGPGGGGPGGGHGGGTGGGQH